MSEVENQPVVTEGEKVLQYEYPKRKPQYFKVDLHRIETGQTFDYIIPPDYRDRDLWITFFVFDNATSSIAANVSLDDMTRTLILPSVAACKISLPIKADKYSISSIGANARFYMIFLTDKEHCPF